MTQQATELIAKQMAAGASIGRIWGTLLFNVKDAAYGSVGDGVKDDTAAIQAAINAAKAAGGGTVLFPAGTYRITSTLVINGAPVSLVGSGAGWGAWINELQTDVTTIKYDGAVASQVVQFVNVNFGFKMEGIKLDCNSKASIGLEINSCQGGRFSSLSILNSPTIAGLKLTASNMTCSWNTFTNMDIQTLTKAGTKGIWLTGLNASYNTCHNTFINTKIDFGGTGSHGILLGNCDNNAFFSVYEFRDTGGTGNGVYCDPTETSTFPVANWFYHLQSSVGGWYQPAGVTDNAVIGYATDNGQPDPVLNGGELIWLDMRGRMHPIRSLNGRGSKPGNNLSVSSQLPASTAFVDISFPQGAEPDASYAVFFAPTTSPGTGQFYASNQTANGFRVNITTTQTFVINFTALIVR